MWIAPPSGLRFIRRADDGVGELGDLLAHARGRGALAAVDGEERLGHRDRDLRRLEADHRAVAADHLVLRRSADRSAVASVVPGSPAIRSRGEGAVVGAAGALAICMGGSPVISCRCEGASRGSPRCERHSRKPASGAGFRARPRRQPLARGPRRWPGAGAGLSARYLLRNQNLLHLVFKCRINTKHSGRPAQSQGFLMHNTGARRNDNKNSRLAGAHRGISPGSSTACPPASPPELPTTARAHVAAYATARLRCETCCAAADLCCGRSTRSVARRHGRADAAAVEACAAAGGGRGPRGRQPPAGGTAATRRRRRSSRRARVDEREAGHAAERGQDRAPPSEHEARQARAVVAAAADAHARMHVAAQRVAGARRRGHVAGEERRQRDAGSSTTSTPQRRRRVAGVRVVVAAHQPTASAGCASRHARTRRRARARRPAAACRKSPSTTRRVAPACARRARRAARGRRRCARAAPARRRRGTPRPCPGARRRRTACARAASTARVGEELDRLAGQRDDALAKASAWRAARERREARGSSKADVRIPHAWRSRPTCAAHCGCRRGNSKRGRLDGPGSRAPRRVATRCRRAAGVATMPRFAANLSFLFNEVPFLDRFAEAAHAGFRAVEFTFPYEYQARDLVAARDAPPSSRSCCSTRRRAISPPATAGLACAAGPRARLRRGASRRRCAMRRRCAAAAARDGRRRARPTPTPSERSRQRTTLRAQPAPACKEAAAQASTVLIEPLNPRDMPGYLLSTQAEAHAIREEVGAPNLKVQMDLYHAQIVEGDLTEKLRRWLPHIGHIQIAGVPGRHEPDVGEINYDVAVPRARRAALRRLGRLRVPAAQEHAGRPVVALPAARPQDVGPGLISRPHRRAASGSGRILGNVVARRDDAMTRGGDIASFVIRCVDASICAGVMSLIRVADSTMAAMVDAHHSGRPLHVRRRIPGQ